MKSENENQQFEHDLNLLETPPHKSMVNPNEIEIQTKIQLESRIHNHPGKFCITSETMKLSKIQTERSTQIRALSVDNFPLDLNIGSHLRTINQKTIQVKQSSQSKLNALDSQASQSSKRRQSSQFHSKGILKHKQNLDSPQTQTKRSGSVSSGKSVRFSLTDAHIRQSLLFRK